MERLEVNYRCRRLCGPPAKQLLRAVQQLVFSLFDLVGAQVKLLRQFVQRLLTAHRLQSHLRLESTTRLRLTRRSMSVSQAQDPMPREGSPSTYSTCPNSPSQLSDQNALFLD